MHRRFGENLRSSVAASAAPYGYTLTIWSSGAVSVDVLGKPDVFKVLMFMAGAVVAFMVVESLAYRSLRPRLVQVEPARVTVWGNAHIVSAGTAIGLVWVLDHVLDGTVGWPLAGFAATAVYLNVTALQTSLASEVEEEHDEP